MRRIIATLAGTFMLVVGLAGTASAASNNEHLTIHLGAGNSGTLSATGPISGTGVTHQLTNNTDLAKIPGKGTFILAHHPQTSSGTFDPVTCKGTFTETGTFQIREGTGHFDGEQGHGTYTLNGTFVGVVTPTGCGRGGTFSAVAHLAGNVNPGN